MIYIIINSRKLRNQRAFICCLLVISFLITFSSCTTTEMTSVSPESIGSGSQEEITKIELKNGTKINCKNKSVKIENRSDSTGYITISTPDTVRSGNDRYSIRWNKQQIPLSDVMKIQFEKTETDGLKTALVITGIAAGIAVAYFIVLVIAINGANLK